MLADADVDVDVAREQIATLGPGHPHIVLFVSENDRALAASQAIWDAPRLGAIDPNVEPYKTMLEQEHLSVINMTNFPSHDFFNHGKFAEDPRVVALIGRRLAAGQTLTDRRVGLGARIMQVTLGLQKLKNIAKPVEVFAVRDEVPIFSGCARQRPWERPPGPLRRGVRPHCAYASSCAAPLRRRTMR